MGEHPFKCFFWIGLTVLLSLLITLLPWPQAWQWYQPPWVLLVLIFWMMAIPEGIAVITVFFVGLLVDLLTGTLLGQHAFLFTLIAYLFFQLRKYITGFPLWPKFVMVIVLTVIYFFVQYIILWVIGKPYDTYRYWWPLLTTPLIWPWLYLLLNDVQRRFALF